MEFNLEALPIVTLQLSILLGLAYLGTLGVDVLFERKLFKHQGLIGKLSVASLILTVILLFIV